MECTTQKKQDGTLCQDLFIYFYESLTTYHKIWQVLLLSLCLAFEFVGENNNYNKFHFHQKFTKNSCFHTPSYNNHKPFCKNNDLFLVCDFLATILIGLDPYLVIDCYIVLVSTKDLYSLSPRVRKRDLVVSFRCSTKHLEEIRDIGNKVTAIFVLSPFLFVDIVRRNKMSITSWN